MRRSKITELAISRQLTGGGSSGGGGTDERFKQLVEGTLTEINDSEITEIASYAFYYCLSLEKVNLPNVTKIKSQAFKGASELTDVFLPLVTGLSNSAFEGCTRLPAASFPSVTKINSQKVFSDCCAMEFVDFLSLLSISEHYVFSNDYGLKAVVLRSNTMCTLGSTTCFYGCYHFLGTKNNTYNPEGLKDGYIYVPSALIDSYKAATNWTTFADQFRALEDYTVDGTTTGDLDWEKVNA